ncbi:hypothetical protein LI99_26715 [Mycolicibacterium smegmatis]|uniref:Uncharacterized protein n=2 Tax=Mycolicibacterium smegmatis (strain ATCC 700084 / mc(2)155) TaxID=246196 RepID=I7GE28_MYCS2|nr:hypothetical protein MSMEG_5406 [Mycolicibacterium smegmatis MC2 155]AIU17051.1 hypothetical protein LI99_26715 [Mycolicibacterium smegmatis]AFP41701.1 hypothetical protein MSMEI_5258 [Mycolicibacterium smegmatis MC2 155]AIU10426.1 hypothetical protein LJ00_26710 [Mycolicibacterium smegmatis MC2 155]AIU23674.1 hypothetical protein LI98_26720 [Mycolicibacterium smegmatis]
MSNDAHRNQGKLHLSLQRMRRRPPLRKPAELQRTALTP